MRNRHVDDPPLPAIPIVKPTSAASVAKQPHDTPASLLLLAECGAPPAAKVLSTPSDAEAPDVSLAASAADEDVAESFSDFSDDVDEILNRDPIVKFFLFHHLIEIT